MSVALVELCSNSRCPLTQRCHRSVIHHVDIQSRVGLTERGIKIAHYHPTGRGQYQDCNYYMRRV